jgi:uncharacterized protein RhaS with RHS repeats
MRLGGVIQSETFGYNTNGNRTQRLVKSGAGVLQKTLTYTLNDRDQVTSVNSTVGVAAPVLVESYQYDVNGNVVQATKSGATTTFKYDRLNRQIEQLVGSTTTQWEMDFADRRALQKEGAVETQYQWDGIRLQSESSAAGAITSTYRWGMELIGQAIGGQARRLWMQAAAPVIGIDIRRMVS